MNEDVRALKDALENRKNTKKRIKKDSYRYFVKKFKNLWTYAKIYSLNFSVRGVLQYDKQVKKKHDCEHNLSPVILIGKGLGNH